MPAPSPDQGLTVPDNPYDLLTEAERRELAEDLRRIHDAVRPGADDDPYMPKCSLCGDYHYGGKCG